MSTLTSQQTLRALCGHLYRPLRHPLRRPLRRPTGSVQAPFSGYDTLTQHFSPKATDSNGYVDIHDLDNAGDLELNNYDVRITDINERTLRTEISKALGIDYLAKATEADAKREIDAISGYLYGEGHRAMVPCVVSNGNKAYWVHFLVDTGAPITFLSEKVNPPPPMRRVCSAVNLILGMPHSRPGDRSKHVCHHCWMLSPNPNGATEVTLCRHQYSGCRLLQRFQVYAIVPR
jgi:hypothetical protein